MSEEINKYYNKVVCRGCKALGTACGKCAKCLDDNEEQVRYWLCCGSLDPKHNDFRAKDCKEALMGHPERCVFGTKEDHSIKEKQQTIYQRAVTKFGVDKQIEKLEQELIELLLALSHMKEGRHDHNVPEELCDVRFMLRQIIPLYNEEGEVDHWHDMKAERLEGRLK